MGKNKDDVLQRLLEDTFNHADAMMRSQGQVHLAFRVFTRKGDQYLMVPWLEGGEERRRLIQVAFVAYDVALYAVMTEAWEVKCDSKDEATNIRPSKSDKRYETLLTLANDGRRTLFRSGIIRRDDKGNYAGYDLQSLNFDAMGGALSDLLPVPPLPDEIKNQIKAKLTADFGDTLQILEIPYGSEN